LPLLKGQLSLALEGRQGALALPVHAGGRLEVLLPLERGGQQELPLELLLPLPARDARTALLAVGAQALGLRPPRRERHERHEREGDEEVSFPERHEKFLLMGQGDACDRRTSDAEPADERERLALGGPPRRYNRQGRQTLEEFFFRGAGL
jgi:hypothetical protein